jgi:hypothetical protein
VTEEYFVPKELRQHPAWIRLNAQLSWYDRKSGDNQRRYKQIKSLSSSWRAPYRSSHSWMIPGADG